MLIISTEARVSPLADIEDSVRGSVIAVEANATIDSFVKIKPAGGTGDVRIGAGSVVNSGTVIYSGNGVDIGRDVLIAANCTLAPVNHEYHDRGLTIKEQRFMPSKGGIVIEDDVWIGAGSVILDGARLRRGCVVGALSLVVGELAPYSVNVGAPTRQIGVRS
ncbi:acyltransferase [Paenibacillus cymbidii]|uniref:acyltransferase n=1 Tax=Paenibacillus cymbidii TaxID=1639034 RepID=UPI001080C04B|nr:acyltransferase [Paenibacillus cymbidii]